ncbi:MAG: gamma-D-glutamyl-meso-diaminopimelate peptidase [Clostridia bacterium]|nr:gamma-D-glutamyl-meso-diaminopimelate peptidase [Clostridia bacterium]
MEEKRFAFFKKPPDKRRQAEITTYLKTRHPRLFWGAIGHSILGEELRYARLGCGKRALLYVGAHHGMEWITSLILYRLIDDLARIEERTGKPPLPEDHSLYMLPMLNPDGVEIELHGAAAGGPLSDRLVRQNGGRTDFSRWQANARGVDLNHNYDAGFCAYRVKEKEAGITGGCPTRYSGEYPFSEPETAALAAFLAILQPAAILTLHSQGEEIFYHPVSPPIAGADALGMRLARLTGYRLGEADGMAAYGGMSDYAAEGLRLRAYTIECGLGQNPLPIRDAPVIYRRLRRALFLLPTLL